MPQNKTAAILIIGDEILSGRTLDTNSNTIAVFLNSLGIDLKETRVVGDDETAIINAVNALRHAFDYVFTCGGIGPTHDDITADSIAKAFGVEISVREDAVEYMLNRYKLEDLNQARLRMARIPKGASLIKNPVSFAPGFNIGNVFVMAGVPHIMRSMLEDIAPKLTKGKLLISKTIAADNIREGEISAPFGEIAKNFPDLGFGSYPWFNADGYGAKLVVRGFNESELEKGVVAVIDMLKSMKLSPKIE